MLYYSDIYILLSKSYGFTAQEKFILEVGSQKQPTQKMCLQVMGNARTNLKSMQ